MRGHPFVERVVRSGRTRLQRGLRRISERYLRPYILPTRMDRACVRCGYDTAYLVDTPVRPDFPVEQIEAALREPLVRHRDAICANCGLYQAYVRFEPNQIEQINGIGKDALTTDEVYHSYPIPEDYIRSWYGTSMETLVPRWRNTFRELNLVPRRVLFLRYWFGWTMEFVHSEWNAEVYGVDISPICRRHVTEHFPFVRHLEGSINGHLAGPFLEAGPFDAIFVQHILVHATNVVESIRRLRGLIAPGGFLHLGAESKVSPTNPFHKFYPSEYQLHTLLEPEFDAVYKLDQNGIIRQENPRQHSGGACIEWIATVA